VAAAPSATIVYFLLDFFGFSYPLSEVLMGVLTFLKMLKIYVFFKLLSPNVFFLTSFIFFALSLGFPGSTTKVTTIVISVQDGVAVVVKV